MYDVAIEGLTEQINALDRYDDIAEAELNIGMRESVKAIAQSAAVKAPRWHGDLSSSMQSRVLSTGSVLMGEVYSTATPPEYPLVMEYGRRAGAKPPPTSAIADWVEDHLGDRRLAFVVARSIGRKGIKPHYFLRRAYNEVAPAIVGLFELVVQRIAQKLAVRP